MADARRLRGDRVGDDEVDRIDEAALVLLRQVDQKGPRDRGQFGQAGEAGEAAQTPLLVLLSAGR
jgi:hypothetical protein